MRQGSCDFHCGEVTPLARHEDALRQIGCVVCRRLHNIVQPPQLHHIVDGDDWSQVPLCEKHHDPHRTGSGFHGMGAGQFVLVFKVPRLQELGLLVWVMEDLAKYGPRML